MAHRSRRSHSLAAGFSLLTFASFCWGVWGYFRRPGGGGRGGQAPMPRAMARLSLLSLFSYAALLARLGRGRHRRAGEVAGCGLFVVAASLFWWSVATTRRDPLFLAYTAAVPDRLHLQGPYRHIRHPFYLSYILFWIGTGLVAGGAQWPLALGLTWLYHRRAVAEERDLLRSPLGAAYHEYQLRTAMPISGTGALGRMIGTR